MEFSRRVCTKASTAQAAREAMAVRKDQLAQRRRDSSRRAARHWATTRVAKGRAVSTGSLTNEELQRYSRHLILPEVGVEGQV